MIFVAQEKGKTMDDLISREQALDAIHDWKPSDVFDEFNPTTAFTIICALPSANPDLSGYSDRLWKSAYDRGYERCKQDAIEAVDVKCLHRGIVKGIQEIIEDLPSAQPDNRLTEIAELVEGAIDHFNLEDAMDLLYQIKEVLKNG